MWPGREMVFLKGNLPTVSRVVAPPCPATPLPLWQCRYGSVAERFSWLHTEGLRWLRGENAPASRPGEARTIVNPAILTPFAGVSRFPRQSLNGGARDRYETKSCSEHPLNRQPNGFAAPRRCLLVRHKRRSRTMEKRLPRSGMPSVRDLRYQTGNQQSLEWALPLDTNLYVQPLLFNTIPVWGEEGGCVLNKKWQRKRREVIARAGGVCESCHERPGQHVHHFCYAKRLGTEPLDWLQYVCLECHGLYHPGRNFKPHDQTRRRKQPRSRANCRHCGGAYLPKKHRRICVKFKLA